MQKNIWNDKNLIKMLNGNGIVVMPTDTIYGIVGNALNKDAINRIYGIKGRSLEKPCIILIGDIKELTKFSIFPTEEQKKILKEYWPGPVSIILDCPNDKFSYLHRGTKTLAFRIPILKELRDLLLKTGPLSAPSANIEGMPASKNIQEAKAYFGNEVDPVRVREGSQRPSTSNGVDLYIEGGEQESKASKLIKLNNDGSITILRT